jgi:hypothetical protein
MSSSELLSLTPVYHPPVLKAVKIDPANPFKFDFILDQGDQVVDDVQIQEESQKQLTRSTHTLTTQKVILKPLSISPKGRNRRPQVLPLRAEGPHATGKGWA